MSDIDIVTMPFTFSQAFYTMLVIWGGSEIALAALVRANSKSDQKRDSGSFGVVWGTIFIATFAGGWLSGTHVARWPEAWLDGLHGAGVGLIALGLAIRWIAILTLRRFFTVDVAIRNEHRVVQTGVYRFIRHPAYAGALMSFLGLGVAFGSWLSLCVVIIPIGWAFLHRIRIEEAALLDGLGEEYLHYCARTARLLPGVW
jgi:protein-S-isoprenylcysteine O-methyltransferase